MNQDTVANRMPLAIWLAPLVPSFALAVLHVLGQLEMNVPHVSAATMGLVWVCTTVPLVILAFGVRSLSRTLRGDDLEHHMAVTANAVTWAEGLLERARLLLEEADGVLQRRIDAAAASKPEGATAQAQPLAPPRRLPWVPVLLISIGLAFSGIVTFAVVTAPEPSEFVHLHATFAVFANGERINFTDPAFDLQSSGYLRAHMHNPDPASMHIEGEPGLTLSEFFQLALASEISRDSMTLHPEVHGGVTYTSEGNQTLRVFVAPNGGNQWTQLPHVSDYVMRDLDRILITYGNASGEELAAQFATVPTEFP